MLKYLLILPAVFGAFFTYFGLRGMYLIGTGEVDITRMGMLAGVFSVGGVLIFSVAFGLLVLAEAIDKN